MSDAREARAGVARRVGARQQQAVEIPLGRAPGARRDVEQGERDRLMAEPSQARASVGIARLGAEDGDFHPKSARTGSGARASRSAASAAVQEKSPASPRASPVTQAAPSAE